MRKSQPSTGVRPFRVGIAVAATVAAVMAGTTSAAFATATADQALVPSVTQIATQGGTPVDFTITTSGTSLSTMAVSLPFQGWFVTAASCTTLPVATTSTAVPAGTALTVSTSNGNDVISIVTPALTAGAWRWCVWDNAGVLAGHSSSTLLAVPFGTLSAVTGPAGGGNSISLTATGAFSGSSYATEFNTSACGDKYVSTSPGTIIASTTTSKASADRVTITVPTSVTAATGYYVCVYNGTTAGTSTLSARTATTYGAYATTLPLPTVTPTTGSSGAGGNITLIAPAGTVPTTGTMGAIFTRNSCPAANITATTATHIKATVSRISTSKVVVVVPAGVASAPREPTTPWNVCLYSLATTSGTLLTAPATYTVAPVLDLTGVNNTAGYEADQSTGSATPSISPTGGPAQGGTTVQISDLDGIPTADGATLQVSLGGSLLTNVRAIDANTITGVTTAHAPGPVNLTITTAAGSKSTLYGLDNATTHAGVFNFSYAINVAPNTAPPATTAGVGTDNPTLDIMGAGFSSLTFQDIPGAQAATRAHVLLVNNGWYNQTASGNNLTTGTGLANPLNVNSTTVTVTPITQCTGVLVIGDNELVCTLQLSDTLTGHATQASAAITSAAVKVPVGTYTVTVINTGGTPALQDTSYNYSIVTSSSTFTVAPF